ncbi:hypothetical protein EL75_4673 [Escherichia coli]|nr:hypothetical protein EL75_4673 [Escherichia coli]KGM76364.1 hypothetical protein EL79_5307 [Escherichia coli]
MKNGSPDLRAARSFYCGQQGTHQSVCTLTNKKKEVIIIHAF